MKVCVTLFDKAAPKYEQSYLYFRGGLAREKFPEHGIEERALTPRYLKRSPLRFLVRTVINGKARQLRGYVTTQGDHVVRYDSRTFGD